MPTGDLVVYVDCVSYKLQNFILAQNYRSSQECTKSLHMYSSKFSILATLNLQHPVLKVDKTMCTTIRFC